MTIASHLQNVSIFARRLFPLGQLNTNVLQKTCAIPIYPCKTTVLCDVLFFKCFYMNMHLPIVLCCGMQIHCLPKNMSSTLTNLSLNVFHCLVQSFTLRLQLIAVGFSFSHLTLTRVASSSIKRHSAHTISPS